MALPEESSQEARSGGVIAQGTTDLIDAEIDSPLVINERAVTPKATLNFDSGHDLPGSLRKKHEHLKGLRMDPEGHSGFA